jgi:hypothetical protein
MLAKLYESIVSTAAQLPEFHSQIPLIEQVGNQGISEDESETEIVGGREVTTYTVLELSWRSKALGALYSSILLKKAATKSLSIGCRRASRGNKAQERLRTGRIAEDPVVPPCLPINCYDSQWLKELRSSGRDYEYLELDPAPTPWPFPVRCHVMSPCLL